MLRDGTKEDFEPVDVLNQSAFVLSTKKGRGPLKTKVPLYDDVWPGASDERKRRITFAQVSPLSFIAKAW